MHSFTDLIIVKVALDQSLSYRLLYPNTLKDLQSFYRFEFSVLIPKKYSDGYKGKKLGGFKTFRFHTCSVHQKKGYISLGCEKPFKTN